RNGECFGMADLAKLWCEQRSAEKDESCSVSENYSFSTETEVAFVTAKTLSPSFRFIRSTEPVVIMDVTIPAAVLMTTSDITLSETIFSIVPCKRFRMLVLMVVGLFAFDSY